MSANGRVSTRVSTRMSTRMCVHFVVSFTAAIVIELKSSRPEVTDDAHTTHCCQSRIIKGYTRQQNIEESKNKIINMSHKTTS